MTEQKLPAVTPQKSRGAAGKAFLVYLGSGSILAAIVAYFLFSSMGC